MKKPDSKTKTRQRVDCHDHRSGRLRLDKRAHLLGAAPEAQGDGDDLLTTEQLIQWLQVSRAWAEIARGRGYGPPFVWVSSGIVRYRRAAVLQWLRSREHFRVADRDPGPDMSRRKHRVLDGVPA